MSLTLSPVTPPAASPSATSAGYTCINLGHTAQRQPLLLDAQHAANAYDALAWLVTRGCHIAEQLDTEPRRQVQHQVLGHALQQGLLQHLRTLHAVTLEIADPETVFELSIRRREEP